MLDSKIERIMRQRLSASILNENFVENHFLVATAFFDPWRRDLPELVKPLGFPSGESMMDKKQPEGTEENPILIDSLDADRFAKK